jgi:transcriptional regulator
MYLPKHFAEERPEVLHGLIRSRPLATLVTLSAEGLVANSLPLLLVPDVGGRLLLQGHVARANPVWRESLPGVDVLALFQGDDAYISPSWYPAKAEHGRVVPTWNYVTVQARGRLRFIDDAAWLKDFLDRLTLEHEGSRVAPWAMSDAPVDYIKKMLAAVVGLELEVTQLVGKWKASQNQPVEAREGVARGLQEEGCPGPADVVAASLAESRAGNRN